MIQVIYYLIQTRPPEEKNLGSCAEMVRAADSEGGSGKLSELMNELAWLFKICQGQTYKIVQNQKCSNVYSFINVHQYLCQGPERKQMACSQ